MSTLSKSTFTLITASCLIYWTGHVGAKVLAEELDIKVGVTTGLISYEEKGSDLSCRF